MCMKCNNCDNCNSNLEYNYSEQKFECHKCKRIKREEEEKKDFDNPRDDYITFGKHKCKKFSWIFDNDKSYCKWILDQKSTNNDFIRFQNFVKQKYPSLLKIDINYLKQIKSIREIHRKSIIKNKCR